MEIFVDLCPSGGGLRLSGRFKLVLGVLPSTQVRTTAKELKA